MFTQPSHMWCAIQCSGYDVLRHSPPRVQNALVDLCVDRLPCAFDYLVLTISHDDSDRLLIRIFKSNVSWSPCKISRAVKTKEIRMYILRIATWFSSRISIRFYFMKHIDWLFPRVTNIFRGIRWQAVELNFITVMILIKESIISRTPDVRL